MAQKTPDPSVRSSRGAYTEMAEGWELLHDLLGGTRAMRNAGEKWLPREPKEESDRYMARLRRSILLPGYSDAVDDLSDRPFAQPVKLTNAPVDIENDVTGEGESLTELAKTAFRFAIIHGLTHLFVDFSKMPENATKNDELRLKPRPFINVISAPNLIDWIIDPKTRQLTFIRILECVEDAEGKPLHILHDWTNETWVKYIETATGSGQFVNLDSGVNRLGKIPLVTVYFKRVAPMQAKPPLEALAWTNLAHWQSYSDHRNILRFARLGILYMTGVTEKEATDFSARGISPNTFMASTNADARIGYAEYSGGAIDAGFRDLEMLRQTMEAQGLAPLVDKVSGDEAATTSVIDENRAMSSIQAWIHFLERGLTQAYNLAAEWASAPIDDKFVVDIYDEFVIPANAFNDLNTLNWARERKQISHETYIFELRRRGFLAEQITSPDELKKLSTEPSSADPSKKDVSKNQGASAV